MLLVTTFNNWQLLGDCYYVFKANSPIKLSRLQGSVQSVAFSNRILSRNSSVLESSVVVLIGTSVGLLYEASFTSDPSYSGKIVSKEKSCRVAHKLDHPIAITSLCIELVSFGATARSSVNKSSSGSSSSSADPQLLVLCGTSAPTRLYHFVGQLAAARQSFHSFFSALSGDSSFTELPSPLERHGRGIAQEPLLIVYILTLRYHYS